MGRRPKSAISKIIPAAGYLLISPSGEEKRTASGIVLPDSHEEKPQKGTVVAVGKAMITDYGTKVEAPCNIGDVVIYKKWSGNEYKPEGEDKEHLFVKFDDILGIER